LIDAPLTAHNGPRIAVSATWIVKPGGVSPVPRAERGGWCRAV